MEYKIYSYLDSIIDAYQEPVQLVDGLYHNAKQTLKTIEFYSNDTYESGKYDALGREKPFVNANRYRVTIAKTNSDIDVKDIKYEPDSLKDSVAAMIINKELFKYFKESNFSQTLNDMGLTRPKYGGVLVKKYQDDEGMEIEVVAWNNVDFDPACIEDNIIIETHYMSAIDLMDKMDSWENVKDLLQAHAKANKNKPSKIEVKEMTGDFPVMYDPEEIETDENRYTYKRMCFYIGLVGKKKFFLYKEDLNPEEDKYKYLAWDAIPGRSIGRGIVEDGFEAQVWINDAMISWKNAMELSGKVLLGTDSQKISGNAITGVNNGHIFQFEPGRTLTSLNLSPSAMPEFQNLIAAWNNQYDKTSSTYSANTGEAPTAGTPYSQTALLNQVANSPFEYQREVWGIFLNEILNDWILPYLLKKIKKEHVLVADYTDEELTVIDKAIHTENVVKMAKEKLLKGELVTPEDQMGVQNSVNEALSSFGNKREIIIPDKFLEVEGKLTANITGELKNKQAILQSLDGIMKTIVSTFNPNTGTFGALEDPRLAQVFGQIVEMSGAPVSFAALKGTAKPTGTAPAPVPSPASVSPVAPIPA